MRKLTFALAVGLLVAGATFVGNANKVAAAVWNSEYAAVASLM